MIIPYCILFCVNFLYIKGWYSGKYRQCDLKFKMNNMSCIYLKYNSLLPLGHSARQGKLSYSYFVPGSLCISVRQGQERCQVQGYVPGVKLHYIPPVWSKAGQLQLHLNDLSIIHKSRITPNVVKAAVLIKSPTPLHGPYPCNSWFQVFQSYKALIEHLPNFTINLVCQRPFLSILPGISSLVSCSIDSRDVPIFWTGQVRKVSTVDSVLMQS